MSLDRGRGRMRVAITFRYQAEHESRDDEYGYSFLCWRETESLPHFIEFETAAPFNHEYFCVPLLSNGSVRALDYSFLAISAWNRRRKPPAGFLELLSDR